MLERNRGHVVSIASVMAFQGVPRLSDYSASKAAALSFAESLRYELKRERKDGISVTAICPYHITTELFKGEFSVPLINEDVPPINFHLLLISSFVFVN